MQSAKEAAANVAASAKAGMEKTKAAAQEKAEKMTTRDPLQKEMATQKKEERIHEAEREKLAAREQNIAAKQTGGMMGPGFTTGQGGVGHTHGTTQGTVGSQFPTGTTGHTGVQDPSDVPGAGVFGSGASAGRGHVGAQDPNVPAGGARTKYT